MRNDALVAEVAASPSHRLGVLARAGEMALAQRSGLLVQFAGLAPSSRRWSLNRLARLMAGCTPNSLM
jgi:hypothetical protein